MANVDVQLPTKPSLDAVILLASITDAVAHTVNGAATFLPRPRMGMAFELDVTAAAAAVGDTLDVKIQTTLDGSGATWVDVVHFTQVLGNGGAKRFYAKLVGGVAEAMYEDHTASLAAGSIKNHLGDNWRYTYTIVDGGAHGQSFTFSIHAIPF